MSRNPFKMKNNDAGVGHANNMFQNAHDFTISGGVFVAGDISIHESNADRETRKKNEVLNWLRAPDPSNNYNAAREKHCAGTGSWFLNGEEYNTWKAEASRPLIIYGSPGYGKTVLCSSVVEDVEHHCQRLGSKSAYAYFFFDARASQDSDLQLHLKFVLSLIKQFSSQHSSIPPSLERVYGIGEDTGRSSIPAMERALREILDHFEHAFIIADALDECTDRQALSKWIASVTKAGNLHFLASRRPEPGVSLEHINHIRVNLESGAISPDIDKYLEEEISADETLSMIPVKDIQRITANADGMFRLVAFRLDQLRNCLTAYDVEREMVDLPRDLDTMYDRIILKMTTANRKRALVILQALVFSVLPLTLEELAEFVAVDFPDNNGLDKPHFDSRHRFLHPRAVITVCGGLISASGGKVKLSHLTVKEYLCSDRRTGDPLALYLEASLAHSVIAQACLAYLLQFSTREEANKEFPCAPTRYWWQEVNKEFPLDQYAARYWFIHAKLINGFDNARGVEHHLIMELLDSGFGAFAAWLIVYNPDGRSTCHPLYYASQLGLIQPVAELIENGANPNSTVPEGRHGSALCAALGMGHLDVALLLLEKGADPNSPGSTYPPHWGGDNANALQVAVQAGYFDIVQLLLEKGADPNVPGGFFKNALRTAISLGKLEMVPLLLEKGADPTAQALDTALNEGYLDIVQLLFEKGANPNAEKKLHALQAAAKSGHLGIAQLLLDKFSDSDPDVQALHGYYLNAMQMASENGHLEIVQLLLENTPDPNEQGGIYEEALESASRNGHLNIVELLLEKGADPNMQGGYDGNALRAASAHGHLDIVQLLLKNGADPNAKERHYLSALQVASINGNKEIVQILLANGADPNIQGGYHENALQAASAHGYLEIVQLLLEKGSVVSKA